MRACLLFLLLSAVVAVSAENGGAPIPTFGEACKDSIRVLASGHGIEKVGYYHVTSSSLAVFVKEDKVRISRLVRDVRIIRKDGDQEYWHRVQLEALKGGKDFSLREGDTLLFVTPII